MKIKFKSSRLYSNLIIGIIWTGLGVFSLLEKDNIRWTNYVYLLVGILYLGHYFYDILNQYLTIENGTIRKNGLYGFGKKINLNEITAIKKFAGDYIITTETKKLSINTNVISKESLSDLNKVLSQLSLPPDKSPFS